MKGSATARIALCGVVAGLGLAVGGIAIANAGDETTTPPSPSSSAYKFDHDLGVGHADPFDDEFNAKLAKALGVEEAEVEAAIADIRADWEGQLGEEPFPDMQQQFREILVKDLDAAVANGTLTEADKDSVLKAFDAGVPGGFHGFGG